MQAILLPFNILRSNLVTPLKWSYTEIRPVLSYIWYTDHEAMLRLTKKADYGLMALKYLAERSHFGSQSAKDIADAYGVPSQLLAKILQRLTKVGLLRSTAGMNGGYALTRPASQITAFEVIHAIDGPLFITSCDNGLRQCDLHDSCTIKEPLRKVNDSISDVLKALSIADLCEAESVDHAHATPGLHTTLVTLGRKPSPEKIATAS